MERSVLLVFAFLTVAFGTVIEKGKCPDVQGMKNFDKSRFARTWPEWGRFPSQTETGARCNVIDFEFSGDKDIKITFSSIQSDGTPFRTVGSGTFEDTDASLNVTFPDFGNNRMVYYFLDTDYDKWATMFACRYIDENQHQLYFWILGSSHLTDKDISDAENSARSNNISLNPLERVQQQNCL